MPNRDKHVRRSGDDYSVAFSALMPQGQAWPRDEKSTLMRVVRGLSQIWGRVDGRAADLLEIESDPRLTTELLPDWERAWGLPDECVSAPLTIEARRQVLVHKMTSLGEQSRSYFIGLAAEIGYTITITEYAPFMAGISQCGDTSNPPLDMHPRWEIGPPQMRFFWTVHVSGAQLMWFRASSGQAGVDPHLRIGVPEDLECLLNKWKPAHTEIVFDLSGSGLSDPMAGTP
jgi:uncharacterized protein YmfQ (DUF2313 family)